MATRRLLTGIGAGSLVLAGAVFSLPAIGVARQEATPVAQGRLLQPGVELADVLETAREGQDGAEARSVSLDDWEDALVYVVELDNGAEIHIDAATGEILPSTLDAGSMTAPIEPTIGLVEAQEAALAGQGEAAVSWVGLADWSGTLTYEVALDNGAHVEVDATTGDILSTE